MIHTIITRNLAIKPPAKAIIAKSLYSSKTFKNKVDRNNSGFNERPGIILKYSITTEGLI